MLIKRVFLGLFLFVSILLAQQKNDVKLGELSTGTTVSFVQTASGEWAIEMTDSVIPNFIQPKPVQIEIYQNEKDIHTLTNGYKILQQKETGINAQAEIVYDDHVIFHVLDEWSLNNDVVSVRRTVEVSGNASGGFNSSIILKIDPSVNWSDMNCLVPGALYGDPTHNGDRSPCGTLNYNARRFILREDMLSAPLFALSFNNGASVAILNPTPSGQSTVEETKLKKDVMIDKRFQVGSLGVWQESECPIAFGYQYPGTMSMYPYGPNASTEPRWIHRFHPIAPGVGHCYEVNFRFGVNEIFRDVTRNTWRWAWNTLQPSFESIDVEQMRRVLIDHLADQAATIDGRTGIPFAVATFDTSAPQWNWTMTAMGFVSKNLECADQLLRESERDKSERGKKMRRLGLSIISSMIQALDEIPLQATGYDLATGKQWTGDRQEWLAPFLRNATEGMRVLMEAYQRENGLGRKHPEWFQWIQKYVDWLILQQGKDGSFPRRWESGSNEVAEATGTTSYCPIPLLVLMSEETGDSKYLNAAVRAGDYVWNRWGKRCIFIGGTSDNPNITDKEAGMLSLEAFLSLYESTKESQWLERAKTAADFTESWIWIWNLPMPLDADNNNLHWKKGVSIIGIQGINARGPGGVDEYLDWSASSYAKLYKYTNDEHYLDVARLLLHATKSMVALPGRLYGMRGIGFQQEHWSMRPGRRGRGVGGHQFWLPWVSANHLYSITGLEAFDPELFKKLAEGK